MILVGWAGRFRARAWRKLVFEVKGDHNSINFYYYVILFGQHVRAPETTYCTQLQFCHTWRFRGGQSLHLSRTTTILTRVLRSASSWDYCGPSYGSSSEPKVSRCVCRPVEIYIILKLSSMRPAWTRLVYTLVVDCCEKPRYCSLPRRLMYVISRLFNTRC